MAEELLAVSSFYQQLDQSSSKKQSTQPTSEDRSSAPSEPSRSVSPVSRWLPFLSSSSQEQTGAGGVRSPCFSEGQTHFHRALPPQPSSMFDTGEDFDEFLPAAR